MYDAQGILFSRNSSSEMSLKDTKKKHICMYDVTLHKCVPFMTNKLVMIQMSFLLL